MPIASCMINFQDVQLAVLDYADAHKGVLPDADKWQDEVAPYYEKEVTKHGMNKQNMIKNLDPNGVWGCENGDQQTGMAFNSDLSAKRVDSIKDPSSTVLIFETPTGSKNANQKYKNLGINGPKVFGSPRPWIVYYVERGLSNMGSKTEFNVSSGSGDDNSDDSSGDSKDSSSPSESGGAGSNKKSGSSEGTAPGAPAEPGSSSN